MSNIKVKDLPEKIDNLKDDDLLMIEDVEDTKKITLLKLRSAFSMDGILISMKEMLLEKINSFTKNHTDKHNELFERNRQLEARCHNLENDHIHDSERIFEFENRLVTQTALINNLNTENDNLNGKVVELENKNVELTNEIVDLNMSLNTCESNISSLTGHYTKLLTDYNNLKDENENLKNIIYELKTSITSKMDNFVDEKNTEIENKMIELMSYIKYYHPDIDEEE